jgi:hypothetical protein
MLGSWSGLMTLVKERNPAIIWTHCIIHRQALPAKILPHDLCNVLNLAIKAVNFVKRSALNIRHFAATYTDLGADHKKLISHGSPLAVKRKYAESTLQSQA